MKAILKAAGILLLGLWALPPVHAQPAPIKWGDIPEEHLTMTSFPADTNAKAVILADYGTVEFERDRSYKFTRHRRIKILSEGGYDWGTFEITYDSDDGFQDVDGIRGQTIKRGPDGKKVVEKMDKKSIFNEKLESTWRRVRFTLPALEPGAVIEYSYSVRTKWPTFLPTWYFQTSEPTLYSEFRPQIPRTLAFVRFSQAVDFHIEEEERVNGYNGEATLHRMAMKDVPALREEPFTTTMDDYRAEVRHQLAEFYDGASVQKYLEDWNTVARRLMDNDYFGGRLGRGRAVRQQAEQIVSGITDPVAKMEAVYDFVRASVSWNGQVSLFLDNELNDVLRSRTGSMAEVNLLLISLLREVGLEANPVAISTRSNGRVIEMYPILSQFNAVLAHVNVGGKAYLLDATDPLRPYTLLPARALSGRGFLLREKDGSWINIEAAGRARHQTLVVASLDSVGGITGTMDASASDYTALGMRSGRKEKDDDARWVKENMLENLAEIVVDSFRIENGDDIKEALKVNASFSLPTYAQAMGDMIYLTPQMLDRIAENPFRLAERTFPVDMMYPREITYSLRLAVPSGFEVQEMPKPVRIAVQSNGATFQRNIEFKDGSLNMVTRFIIAKAVFSPNQYQELKTFYDAVVAAGAEQVVLKRAAPAEGGIQPASAGN